MLRKDLKGIYTIWLRDVKRFFRDRGRIIGATAQPALFLFVLGTGLSSALRFIGGGGSTFLDFIYPGIIGMTVLFTATFSALSIVWDREFGFLKEVLVAPISRTAIVLGKACGGSTQAMLQGLIMLAFAPILGVRLNLVNVIELILLMILMSFALTSFGILIGARMKSMHGFQMVMNFFLMPMFFLSGAMFPLRNLPTWMDSLVRINPLAYGVDAMRYVLIGPAFQAFPIHVDVAVMAILAAVMITGAVISFNMGEG